MPLSFLFPFSGYKHQKLGKGTKSSRNGAELINRSLGRISGTFPVHLKALTWTFLDAVQTWTEQSMFYGC